MSLNISGAGNWPLKACGEDVSISPLALLINPEAISLGSHVRIDAFCILSAGAEGIEIGDYVHLGSGASIYGGGGRVRLDHFAGLSGKASLYTANEDYREGWLTNPTVPSEYRRLMTGEVHLQPHAVVGCSSVILPGVTLGKGCAIGALTLVAKSVEAYAILSGNPPRLVGRRSGDRLAQLEADLRRQGNVEAAP